VITAAGSAGICALAGFRVAKGAFGSDERVALIALVAASALAGEAGLKPRTLILLASTERYFPASKTFGGGLVYPDSTVAARSGRLESVESKCGVVTLG
jgi:hypothetical protein